LGADLIGAYRKDSLKVYYLDFSIDEGPTWRDDCDSSECLLYDFGMQVGDSIFQVRLDSLDHFLTVTQIDTISINGENLKKWTLSSSIDPLFDMVWIEGIGSLLPIFQYFPFFESGTSLLCFYEGNVFYEVVFDFLFCLRLGSEELINNLKVELYPNPAQNEVNIRFLSFHAGQKELVLYNNLSQKLKSINTDKNEVQIDLGELPKGFYFLNVNTRDEGKTFKLIVSD
jgi:hypothetical protein